jgi:hypothetical protein
MQNGRDSSPYSPRGPLTTMHAPKAEEMAGIATARAANYRSKTLRQLYGEHDGKVSDKWSLYLAEYEQLFAPYRDRPIRILEIGIENGGSLELWSKYFWNAAKVLGCDINPDCAKLHYDDPRISTVVGNANWDSTRKRILGHCDRFDIIIDDASHQSKDIICSFAGYFPFLNEGGLYIAEDLHCSYWKEFMGGLYHPGSSMAFFKLLVDVVNREHWGVDKARSELLHHFEQNYKIHLNEGSLRKLHSLEFMNSLCIIRKQDDQSNLLGPRIVGGTSEVVAAIRPLNGTLSLQTDQRGNTWALCQTVDEGVALRAASLEAELGVIGKSLTEKEAALRRVTCDRDALAQTAEAAAAAHAEETRRLRAELGVAVEQLAEKEAVLRRVACDREALAQAAEAAAAAHAEEAQCLRAELGVAVEQLAEKDAALRRVAGECDALAQAGEAAAAAQAEETRRLRAELGVAVKQLAQEKTALECVAGERNALAQAAEAAAAAHADETRRLRAELDVLRKQLAEQEAERSRLANERDALAQGAGKAAEPQAHETRSASVDHPNLEPEKPFTAQAGGLPFIKTSIGWRLTAATRRGAQKYPWLSRQLRRAINLVWLTATLRLVACIRARRRWLQEQKAILSSGLFDADWYLAQNPDVRVAGINPLLHYIAHGAAEGRDPNPLFKGDRYLAENPEVRAAGVNPLLRYLRNGTAEGRAAISPPHLENRATHSILNARFSQLRPIHIYRMPETDARVTMVTDSVNAGSLFGGVGTAMVFCTLLARRLGSPLRVVTRTERPDRNNLRKVLTVHGIPLPPSVEFVHADIGALGRSFDTRQSDVFVTTSWWTTCAVKRSIPAKQIVHLIQEDERMFYPYGDDHLRCQESLSDPDLRFVVNSRLLFDHFLAEGLETVVKNGTWFEPAFSPAHYYFQDRQPGQKLNFVFYARPEHIRNLYYRGIEIIDASIAAGTLHPDRWNFSFVGTHLKDLTLANNVKPTLLQNLDWADYLRLMRTSDLGLTLMYTPHPSYPPLDLAACGAVAATNKFGVKTSLDSYSRNIICSDLDFKSLLSGIKAASILAQDFPSRLANYQQSKLSRDWEVSLKSALDFVAGH